MPTATVPIGMTGELLIGGDSVARGYNNLPDQTAERFVADSATGERIYHSGDYARWLPDGNVAVLGRKDNQVKLRGLRIELGEVEAAITRVSGIKECHGPYPQNSGPRPSVRLVHRQPYRGY